MHRGEFAEPEAIPSEDQGPVLGPGWWHGSVTTLFLAGLALSAVMLFGKSKLPLEQRRRSAEVIFAICSVPFAITMVQVYRLKSKIGTAALFLPHESLPLGFNGSASYRRPLRGGASIRTIDARLQCVETFVKGRGKNQRTFTAIASDEPAAIVVTPGMEQMLGQITFHIPETGPATLFADRLNIKWMLTLRLMMDGCPNTRSSFEVNVIPVVVTR